MIGMGDLRVDSNRGPIATAAPTAHGGSAPRCRPRPT